MFPKLLVLFLMVASVVSFGNVEEIPNVSSDEDVAELAQFAAGEMFGKSIKDRSPSVEVVKASKQVVAGVNYFLTLKITYPDNTVTTCHATIYTQPWKRTRELLKTDCPPIREQQISKGENSGMLPPTDPVVERVAKYVIEQIEEASACLKKPQLKLIDQASQKDGVYSLDLVVCEWPNSASSNAEMPYPCDLRQNLHSCYAEVLTKAGEPQELDRFDCTGCEK